MPEFRSDLGGGAAGHRCGIRRRLQRHRRRLQRRAHFVIDAVLRGAGSVKPCSKITKTLDPARAF
jgi:hypothetical protein